MKPRIAPDNVRRGVGKWRCWSARTSFYGEAHIYEGKGYSPAEAYAKWLRARDGASK